MTKSEIIKRCERLRDMTNNITAQIITTSQQSNELMTAIDEHVDMGLISDDDPEVLEAITDLTNATLHLQSLTSEIPPISAN